LDAWLRGVCALPNPAVPACTELDARVGWRFKPRFELERGIRISLTTRLP
jgi:hypothetical protein